VIGSAAPDVVELYPGATARHARAALEAVLERMPFEVRAVSVDNGSEFMADFEVACRDRGIALFVLPPRSPKLHGSVERANRTHTEEFYEVTDAEPDRASLAAALRDWEHVYNHVRPHQALGYLTPAEYLASLGVDV
jgi:transposase InsO family protein